MPTPLAPTFIQFRKLLAYLRSRGWTWAFTLSGKVLRPIGMPRAGTASLRHHNDNAPDNTWKA